jgi:hypothetical protein
MLFLGGLKGLKAQQNKVCTINMGKVGDWMPLPTIVPNAPVSFSACMLVAPSLLMAPTMPTQPSTKIGT